MVGSLAGLPLEVFYTTAEAIAPEQLRRLLSRDGKWHLRRLTLAGRPTADHLRVIAERPGADVLERLWLGDVEETRDVPPGLVRPGLRELKVGGIALDRLFPGGCALERPWPDLDEQEIRYGPPGLVRPGLSELKVGIAPDRLFPGGGMPRLRRLSLDGSGGEHGRLTPERFPDLVSATFGDGCGDFLDFAEAFPLLGRLDVSADRLDEDERAKLARLGERGWVTAVARTEETVAHEYRESRAPERSPPLDDGAGR